MSMTHRVWMEKVLMVRHLQGLDTDSLARRVYEEQRERAWPGLARETADICQKLGIPDCNSENMLAIGNREYSLVLVFSFFYVFQPTFTSRIINTNREHIINWAHNNNIFI